MLAHRGKLERVQALDPSSRDWLLILSLRLGSLLQRARDGAALPPVSLKRTARGFAISADADWLRALPLTASSLDDEVRQWNGVGVELRVKAVPSERRQVAR